MKHKLRVKDDVLSIGGNSQGFWSGADHIACASNSPYCVISIEYLIPTQRPAPLGTEAFYSEIFVVKDLGKEWRRVGMHRSMIYDYWDQPRPAISSDGKYVVFDSNFGIKGMINVMRLDTGF